METISIPVLVLKNLVLFPENELKIEVDGQAMLKNIALASELHHGYLLVVSIGNQEEDAIVTEKLPKYGVIAKIENILTLPSGSKRVTIVGQKRARVLEYSEDSSSRLIDAIIIKHSYQPNLSPSAIVLRKKLLKNYKLLISKSPHISNELIDLLNSHEDLGSVTDILSSILPIDHQQKIKLLSIFNPLKRAEILLEVINDELNLIELEVAIDQKLRKNIDESQKEYILREKIKIIKEELGEVNDHEVLISNLEKKVKKLRAPFVVKKRIKEEISRYQLMNPNSPEYSSVYNYIELLLDLPWYETSTDESNLEAIKNSLDESHNGLTDIKERIIEYIAVKSQNIKLKNPILCLVGPPGTGKTTLAMSIAKSLNRKFVKMSVGGLHDEAEIFGHRKAYIGAAPGKIITNIKKAGVNNPVFLIDEIDKITSDFKGDPASALLDVLDPEQNHLFTDLYLDLSFNLSRTMFITTANYINDIPEPLRDRLEIIQLSSYTIFEKETIASSHIIPEIITSYKLTDKLVFEKSAITKLIEEYTYEAGVRKLNEQINKIARKVVVKNSPEKIIITKDNLEEYLGIAPNPSDYYDFKPVVGTVNMLAVAGYGGVCFPVEVILYPGKGKLILTGSIGKSMRESIDVIISYLKKRAKDLKINPEIFNNNDIHIHGMLTDIPKDGASAGIAICTALYSALTNRVISHEIAMTGELSLNGDIIPIGGVKEKLIAAFNRNVKNVFLSSKNRPNVSKVPAEVLAGLNIIYVDHMDQIIEYFNKSSRKRTTITRIK